MIFLLFVFVNFFLIFLALGFLEQQFLKIDKAIYKNLLLFKTQELKYPHAL